VFDFSHVDRVLDAMHKAGIKVIVGTPTYAIPTWLARQHPDVLVQRPNGARAQYGARQNMDITHPEYRKACERVIVALVNRVKDHPAVIGYQVDNETKPYDTSGPNVQAAFQQWMRKRFPDLDQLNHALGLDYWSNRINRWEDFPSVNGSINASLSSAFAEFQRELVTEFLAWQAGLVRKHGRKDQFVTHNFDLDWRDGSYGVQSVVAHFEAAKALDIAGVDIYHPGQSKLTGAEIAFGGDLTRSLKGNRNYLLLETQAMGFPGWTPYPGQLRLQAYSHIASGANMVEYWHWGSTANAIETYWRGLLAQDYQPNPTYEEAKVIGAELERLGPRLAHLRKHNRLQVRAGQRQGLQRRAAAAVRRAVPHERRSGLRPPRHARPVGLSADRRAHALRGLRRRDPPPECLCRGRRASALHVQERLLGRERQGAPHAAARRHRRGGGREVQPVHGARGRVIGRRPLPRRPGGQQRALVDGAAHAHDSPGAGPLRASGVGQLRGPDPQPPRRWRGDLPGLHAQR
jgi:hypothetical protein